MHARKLLTGLAAAAVAVSVVAITAAGVPPTADPTTRRPRRRHRPDRRRLRHHPGRRLWPTPRGRLQRRQDRRRPELVSFATGGGTIVLRRGAAAINRPVGSGAGKNLLYGGTNNTDIDFARSSSAQSAHRDRRRTAVVPVRGGHPDHGQCRATSPRTRRPALTSPRSSASTRAPSPTGARSAARRHHQAATSRRAARAR